MLKNLQIGPMELLRFFPQKMDARPPHNSFTPGWLTSAPSFGPKDKLLLIEDNESIASLWLNLMARIGLEVVWSQAGGEALAQFERQRESIVLVVADCRLPDMDGREACRQMRALAPELPLLLCSGSAACLELGPLPPGKLIRFLPKPYSPAGMLAGITQLWNEARQVSSATAAGFV